MKVLHLLASPVFSGPAECVARLALAQRALGHEVSVAVDRKRGSVTSEEPIVPRLRALDLLDDSGLELSVKSTPWAVWKDIRRLRAGAAEVLHSHFSHDHWIATWARAKGVVLVRSIHAPRSLRRLPSADGYTAPTAGELSRFPEGRALVLPALVDPAFRRAADRQALRARLSVTGEPLIGMVSTFQATRRHGLGLWAFERVLKARPGARLALIGDGALRAQLESQASHLGLRPFVAFAGYQSGQAFVEWLQALDEVWVLGLGNDFSARAAAQARACGVRVVAVAEGALPTLADVLVTPEPEAVAAASLSGYRRAVKLPTEAEVAQAVLGLYARAGGAR